MSDNQRPSEKMRTGGQFIRCERNIFWNTYAQECSFRDVYPAPPPYVQTTCFKLWEKYPDYEEAERFIRAQFAIQVEELDYSIPKVVSHFSHLIRPEHDATFIRYRQQCESRIAQLLTNIRCELADRSLRPEQMSCMSRLIRDGVDSPLSVRMETLVECLHWPGLAEILPLTPEMKEILQAYRTEIRQDEYDGWRLLRQPSLELQTNEEVAA